MYNTKIEWTDRSWNPVTGCTKISEGCANCYAESMTRRFWRQWGCEAPPNHFKVQLHPDRLEEPLHWRKPSMVFVCSMGDLFHEDVPDEFIDKVFAVMALCPQHTFQILTKRPERMSEYSLNPNTPKRIDIIKQVILAGRLSEMSAPERTIPINDWEGYFVTTKGRILSKRTEAGVCSDLAQHEMKPMPNKTGHSRVMLQYHGRKERPLIHRIVLEHFDRMPKEGEQCCHIDNNSQNNALWNLHWGTQSDNYEDSKRNGTRRRYSKLTLTDIETICAELAVGKTATEIASVFGVSDVQICNIKNGKQWKPEYMPEWPLKSVWFGVTCENPQYTDRIDILRTIPSAVRFISFEPLLADIGKLDLTGLDWIICGGESGANARPMHPDDARGIRDQCVAAGVPFFFKQWGEYAISGQTSFAHVSGKVQTDNDGTYFVKVGKKAAGRLLDGREWNEFPKQSETQRKS